MEKRVCPRCGNLTDQPVCPICGWAEEQRGAQEKDIAASAKDCCPSLEETSRDPFPEEAEPASKPVMEPKARPKKSAGIKKWGFAAAGILLVVVVGVLLVTSLSGKRFPVTASVPTATVPQPKNAMVAEEDLSRVGIVASSEPFWGQTEYPRNTVWTIRFHSSLKGVPGNAWDVSAAQDGSVLAWMEAHNLHVAANGTIVPNSNASWMFACFTNLKTIDFGGCFNTANATDMCGMFYRCSSLDFLNLRGFDTSNVTNMEYMFADCILLTSLDLSGFDTANVTNMGGMFSNCESLTALDLSSFDTSSVTDMSSMFFCCHSLTSLDLSGFDIANVTNMWAMFDGCRSLTSLDLSSFDTANVTFMHAMFAFCSSLTSLDLSGFDSANVTDMDSMFEGCDDNLQLICTDAKILEEFRNK